MKHERRQGQCAAGARQSELQVCLKQLKAAINAEIGQLHKTQALLIAVQFAANHDAVFDVSDALAAIVVRIEHSLTALDQAEATS